MPDHLSPGVAELLHCPVTHRKLHRVTEAELSSLGLSLPEGGWITEDRSRAYPIRDGFPILVPNESVEIPTNVRDCDSE